MTDAKRATFLKRMKAKYLTPKILGHFLVSLCKYTLLIGISFVILFPFLVKISSTFMSREDLLDQTVRYIPRNPTLDNLKVVLEESNYFAGLRNTAIISFMAASIQTFISAFIGYGLGRFKFKGRNLAFVFVLLTLLIPPQTLTVPMYLTFQQFDFYGLLGLFGMEPVSLISYTVGWFPLPIPLLLLSLFGIGLKNGLFIFIMMQYFKNMPSELTEAAYVDGYGVFAAYFRIMLPLAKSMLATLFLLSFSWQWSDTFYSNMFFRSLDSLPKVLQSVFNLASQGATEGSLLGSVYNNCAGLLIVAPLALLYLFTQRFFTQGIEKSGIVG